MRCLSAALAAVAPAAGRHRLAEYVLAQQAEFTVAHLTADRAMLDEMHCLAYEIDHCLEFVPVEDYHDVTWLVEYTAVIDREK